MHSFLSSAPAHARLTNAVRPQGRPFWHRPARALGVLGRGAVVGAVDASDADAAWQLVYRSEAFAEDLGPAYAAVPLLSAARP